MGRIVPTRITAARFPPSQAPTGVSVPPLSRSLVDCGRGRRAAPLPGPAGVPGRDLGTALATATRPLDHERRVTWTSSGRLAHPWTTGLGQPPPRVLERLAHGSAAGSAPFPRAAGTLLPSIHPLFSHPQCQPATGVTGRERSPAFRPSKSNPSINYHLTAIRLPIPPGWLLASVVHILHHPPQRTRESAVTIPTPPTSLPTYLRTLSSCLARPYIPPIAATLARNIPTTATYLGPRYTAALPSTGHLETPWPTAVAFQSVKTGLLPPLLLLRECSLSCD